MKTVYIVLTRSNTIMSRMVRLFTRAHYTHASLSLSLSDALFYSFGRKNISRPLPAGFVREPLAAGFFGAHPETECALLALPVEDDVYVMIERRLSNMERIAGIYRYNLLGALFCYFGVARSRKRYYFCSQFVGDVLDRSGAAVLPKPSSLMHPMDYAGLDNMEIVYTGNIAQLLQTVR